MYKPCTLRDSNRRSADHELDPLSHTAMAFPKYLTFSHTSNISVHNMFLQVHRRLARHCAGLKIYGQANPEFFFSMTPSKTAKGDLF
jgi:hypothetical protein